MLQDVILSEIRQGNLGRVDDDELISIFFRLIRDAEEGVARNNLRLMARVINGMAEKQKLKAPNFLRYASILSSLSEDEITVLGIMAKDVAKEVRTYTGEMVKRDPVEVKDPGLSELKKSGLEYRSIQQALLRTSLVAMETVSETKQTKKPDVGRNMMYTSAQEDSGFDIDTKTTQSFRLTSLMVEILKYTDSFSFEDL
jgi:hypothetical protein